MRSTVKKRTSGPFFFPRLAELYGVQRNVIRNASRDGKILAGGMKIKG